MKKTVSVNIKGTNFLIEEDAYELLQNYLDRLNVVLKNEEGSQEIIEDIELRIAEICSSKLNDSKTVIEYAEIQEILDALGDPSEYVDGSDEDSFQENTQNFTNQKSEKRLFRDPEAATLGGVCAGIANYFQIDIVIIRAVFVVLGLFGGFGVPLYFILWLIIPKAENTIDRLRMKGRPVTVETVREEVEQAAERLRSSSKSFANRMRNDRNDGRMNQGKRIFRNLFAFWFIAMGFVALVSFILFFAQGFEFLPVNGDQGFMSISEFGALTLSSAEDVQWMWIGGLMASISGILFLFAAGTLLLFRLSNKWTKIALISLVFIGITGGIICAVMGVRAGRDWINDSEIENTRSAMTVNASELKLVPQSEWNHHNAKYRVRRTNQYGAFGVEGNYLTKQGIEIQYVTSPDSLFHIRQASRAHGYSNLKAQQRGKNVMHHFKVKGNILYLDTKFKFPMKDKLRGQQAILIIEVPEGRKVLLNNDVIHLESEVSLENESHHYYRDQGKIHSDGTYDSNNYDY